MTSNSNVAVTVVVAFSVAIVLLSVVGFLVWSHFRQRLSNYYQRGEYNIANVDDRQDLPSS